MSRIGVITIHNSPNYGACLQSYALYEYLRQQRHDVEVIDLHRPFHNDYIPSHKFQPYLHRFEPKVKKYKRKLKQLLKYLIRNKDKIEIHNESNNNYKFGVYDRKDKTSSLFDRFNKRIVLSQPFRSIDTLYAKPPVYDIYITGSDQVWNPTQSYCIEPYFLTFVQSGKKISYASSIGIEHLTKREKHDFKKWLSTYDVISVREDSAKKLLEEIVGKSIATVPDPTFLLDTESWFNLAKRPQTNGYILVFTLSFEKKILDYAINVAEKRRQMVVSLNPNQPQNDTAQYVAIQDAGPEEWLGYIANASLVITDSFHCTLFSILLGINDFKTYISPWNDRGSRIRNLLGTFNLEEHLLHHSELESNNFKHTPINHDMTRDVSYQLQQIGRNFLSASL
jgi:hypothetical protein